MNQSSLWTCESLRRQCKTCLFIFIFSTSLLFERRVKRLWFQKRGKIERDEERCAIGESVRCTRVWVWGKHQVQVCVCLTNIRHTGLERWLVPGWDQVSAASSRDNTGIGCFPPSNSITHHLLHPCFHSLPVLLFHIYLSAPSFSLHSSQPPSLISSLAASLFDSFLFYLFVLFLHHLLIASLVFFFHLFSSLIYVTPVLGRQV